MGETADGHPVDQVISLRFPSYAVRHPRHVCWLNHRMREYYDLWERFTRGLGRKGRLKEGVRRRVFHALDRWLLTRNVTRLVAQSQTIQARLQRFGGIPSELLYPPPPERPYRTDGYGDYIFAVSRLHAAEAARPAGGGGRAHEGPPPAASRSRAKGEEAERLRERIEDAGPARAASSCWARSPTRELVEHYARCRAVYFAPWNEDYGFVTLEAFRSGKAVVTTHGQRRAGRARASTSENGLVGAGHARRRWPAALDALAADRGLAERLGQAARARRPRERITWERARWSALIRTGGRYELRRVTERDEQDDGRGAAGRGDKRRARTSRSRRSRDGPSSRSTAPRTWPGCDYARDLGDPGQFPYTRGIHETMYRGKLWTMRQFAGFGSAAQTNERFKYLLEHGSHGLSVAFDLPTLMGRDPDHPLSLGEVGKCGVAVTSLADMETLFDGHPARRGLDLDDHQLAGRDAAGLLHRGGREAGRAAGRSCRARVQADILKEFIAQKEYIFPPRPSMRIIVDMIRYCTEHMPKWNSISISGYHIREAGSTAAQELAFTLRDGIEYVQWCVDAGMDVDSFAPRLSFFFNSH